MNFLSTSSALIASAVDQLKSQIVGICRVKPFILLDGVTGFTAPIFQERPPLLLLLSSIKDVLVKKKK